MRLRKKEEEEMQNKGEGRIKKKYTGASLERKKEDRIRKEGRGN